MRAFHKAALVVLGLAGVWACADRITGGPSAHRSPGAVAVRSRLPYSEPASRNPYAFVGVIHNQALGYGFQQIRQATHTDRKTSLTKDDYYRIAETSLATFFDQRGMGRLTAGQARDWRGILEQHPNASARELAGVMALQPNDGSLIDVSPEAWSYLNQILWIADNAQTMTELSDQLVAVEFQAGSTLSGTDLEIVYATAAVTASSAAYWEANYDQWHSLCEADPLACSGEAIPGEMTIQRVNGWKVLGADVVGCIAGFYGGAWVGCAIGAAAASINSIIGQI
jgi:hypothetical protein